MNYRVSINKIGNFIYESFSRNTLFIFLFVFLNVSLNIYEWDKRVYQKAAYAFCFFLWSIILAGGITTIRSSVLRKILKIFLLVTSGIVFIADLFTLHTYKTLIGAGSLNAILETNFNETREFLDVYLNFYLLVVLVGSIFLIILASNCCKYLFFLGQRETPEFLKLLFRGVVILGLLSTVVLFTHEGRRTFTCKWGIPFMRIYFCMNETMDNMAVYHDIETKLNTNALITKNDSSIKNVVLIIGESTSRNHMSLYGYGLNTTPKLDLLKKKQELFVYNDVISPHSHTVTSLRKMLTFYNFESNQSWYEYSNLIDVMNQSGYKTFWLSNQESSGMWGDVAKVFSSRSSKAKFTVSRSSTEEYAVYDDTLLPLIEAARQEQEAKKLFVVHLMGTHAKYKKRYPDNYSIFTKNDIVSLLDEDKKATVAEYDNAVYYNDFIVSEIINKFRDDETVLIYLSDHGECVYDDGSIIGHTEEKGNRFMIEIPMVVWVSDRFKNTYPEKVVAFRNSTHRPYMTDDFIHTMLDVVDIQTVEYDPARSVINDNFNLSRKRIYNNVDYDAFMKDSR